VLYYGIKTFVDLIQTTRREPLRGRALRRSSPGLVDFARIIEGFCMAL